jgi:hypothetical protein
MELRLGKLPAKYDRRTIPLKAILRKELLPPLPESYDIDQALSGIDDSRVFGNDQYGDCVIAARAHQTLRFEKYEQGRQIEIADQEVIDQYFRESGGLDSGLYMLNSLKEWRKNGWPVGEKTYTIYAFALVDWKDHEEVMHCIHLLGGINFGMLVYERDIEQFLAGEDWELKPYSGALKGGHGVYLFKYVTGYNRDSLTCMTWGRKQRMTWDFWDARLDEAYGIVDNRNDWLENSPVDVKKLDAYLQEIAADGQEEESECPFTKLVIRAFNEGARFLHRKSRLRSYVTR